MHKIVLFINILLTNSRMNSYDRGILPDYDVVDVFKYMIASLAVLPFSNGYIYCEGADDSLVKYIEDTLPFNVVVYKHRNMFQSEWKEALKPVMSYGDDKTLVWFLCNHDHIFMDNNTECIEHIIEEMYNCKDEYLSCEFSHWPEKISSVCPQNIEIHNNCVKTISNSIDSIQIVNKNLLDFWWYRPDYGNARLARTDYGIYGSNVRQTMVTTYMPLKEQCMHFDSYRLRNISPALKIPIGFFDNNVQLNFYDTNIDQYVNINPLTPNFSDTSLDGTDAKWIISDVPLFWADKISNIKINNNCNRQDILEKRNNNILNVINTQCQKSNVKVRQDINDAILKNYNLSNQVIIKDLWKKE